MYRENNMICSFCVNDYHLAVMIVPYIYQALNEGKKVITFLDRDLEKMIYQVIATNKKFWESEEKLKQVNFKKTEFKRIAEKFEEASDGDIILIAGKDDFIERMNQLILNFHINFTILNCFDIEDIAKNENFKISNYTKILNTKGLENIENVNLV